METIMTAHRITITFLAAALVGLTACGGSNSTDEAAAVTTEPATTTTEAAATTTTEPVVTTPPTTTIDTLERNRTVNEYLDAAAANAVCIDFDCITAQATYDRYTELNDMALQIPGDDIASLRTSVSQSYEGWVGCLEAAASRMDCWDDEDATLNAINDLYNSLR